jgi:hypothetical protein
MARALRRREQPAWIINPNERNATAVGILNGGQKSRLYRNAEFVGRDCHWAARSAHTLHKKHFAKDARFVSAAQINAKLHAGDSVSHVPFIDNLNHDCLDESVVDYNLIGTSATTRRTRLKEKVEFTSLQTAQQCAGAANKEKKS